MTPRTISLRMAMAAAVAVLALGGAGCSRLGSQRAAIEQSIRDHLGAVSDLAMDQMVMTLGDVKVDGDAAGAEVVFNTNSNPPARMSYHYELRKEDGTWKVTGGWPSGSQGAQHPTMSQTEGSAPPGAGSPSDALPEGHPALPEGHPPIPPVPNPHE